MSDSTKDTSDISIVKFHSAIDILSQGVDGVGYCALAELAKVNLNVKLIKRLGLENATDAKFLHVLWRDILHSESVNEVEGQLAVLSGKVDSEIEFEIKCQHVDGSNIWFRCVGFVMPSAPSEEKIIIVTFVDITNYKKAESALRVQVDRFKHVIDGAHFGSWECNIQTGEQRVNDRWAEIIGYSLAELSPVTIDTLKVHSHRGDYEATIEKLEAHVSGEADFFTSSLRMKHRDGHWVWTFIRGKVVSNTKDGKAEWVAGSLYDISHIRQNEIELERNKALLEQVNDTAKIGAWEYNIGTNETYMSDSLKRILEVDLDFVPTLENSGDFFLKEEDREIRAKYLENTLATGESFEHTFITKTYTGKLIWTLATGNVKYENGKPAAVFGYLQDIDDQMNSTLMLEQQEEQFRKTFEYAHNGMCLVSLDGKFLRVNASLCNMLEYTREELESITFQDITHVDFLEEDLAYLQEMIDLTRESYQLEKQYIRKDGTILYALLSVSVVKDNYGEPLHFVSQINDISQRKESELLLAYNTELLESINEAAQIGVWEVNLDDSTVFWSPIIKRLAGVPHDYTPSLEDAIGVFKEGESRDIIAKCVSNAIENGENYDVELEIITNDNQTKWARTIGISTFENGKCVKLHGFFQDIDELKKSQLDIELREEQFRQTFWHSNVAMVMLNLKGEIIRANPEFCAMSGYAIEELITMTLLEIFHPEDLTESQKNFDSVISGKRDNFQLEKRIIRKEAGAIWVSLSSSTVKNDKGELSHIVCQLLDVNENKLLGESLKEHNGRLENFAHIVSHNLRSHTGNMAMLFDLQEQSNSDSVDADLFNMIKTASENMNETVGYLSEIVEINSKVKETLVSLNLLEYVDKAIESVQVQIGKIDCTISKSIDRKLSVMAVPAYLDSIMLNLITNALKYYAPSRKPTIDISAELIGDYVIMRVSDNGQGIDLEKHGDKLFGMYKTFHEHDEARGVGLFISKNQIESMGGRIEVESKVDFQTVFKISFRHEYNG